MNHFWQALRTIWYAMDQTPVVWVQGNCLSYCTISPVLSLIILTGSSFDGLRVSVWARYIFNRSFQILSGPAVQLNLDNLETVSDFLKVKGSFPQACFYTCHKSQPAWSANYRSIIPAYPLITFIDLLEQFTHRNSEPFSYRVNCLF